MNFIASSSRLLVPASLVSLCSNFLLLFQLCRSFPGAFLSVVWLSFLSFLTFCLLSSLLLGTFPLYIEVLLCTQIFFSSAVSFTAKSRFLTIFYYNSYGDISVTSLQSCLARFLFSLFQRMESSFTKLYFCMSVVKWFLVSLVSSLSFAME